MRIAAFENEPEASATATILREEGYNSKVVTRKSESYDQRVRDFFRGKPRTFDPVAFVISDNADFEPFVRVARRHYGFVIRGESE